MATQIVPADQAQQPGRPQPEITSPEGQKFALMQRQAALFASSPLVPQHLRTGTPQQAMANCYIAMTIADRMGEDRMTVMQNIHIVHGTAGFKAQYMIARANASGKFKGPIDWEIVGKGKDLSVTAFATLANTGRRVEITVDMAMAEAEGWTKNTKYKTMPEIMLRYRSATFLVRMYAPEVMLGYQTADEAEDLSAAALPIAEPLTGQALLEQAREAGPDDAEDAQTNDAIGSADEGPADNQRGEIVTLESAKDEIDAATDVKAVNRLVRALVEDLGEADADALRAHAADRCEDILKAQE
jgi:hypothetical protein